MPPLYIFLYVWMKRCYWFDTKLFPPIRIEICDLSFKDFMPFTQNKLVGGLPPSIFKLNSPLWQ